MTFLLEDEYHKSFSQIAKESGFRFNLYRGRIDWKKLDILDVDRIVRDLDMEMLNVHTNSVINCNLDTEYDVKILDPNFVKLFRIAQLTIDFLLHCKHYLERQLHETAAETNVTKHEVEGLRKYLQSRKVEIKELKKKLKQKIQKDKTSMIVSPRFNSVNVQCGVCGKLFVDETYLQSHQARRHAGQRLIETVNHTSFLKEEIKQLKDRLHSAESKLYIENYERVEKDMQVIENDHGVVGKKYQEEIKQLKDMFFSEMQVLRRSTEESVSSDSFNFDIYQNVDIISSNCQSNLNDMKLKQNAVKADDAVKENTLQNQKPEEQSRVKPIPMIVEENCVTEASSNEQFEELNQDTKNESYWEGRLEAREAVWRARLSALDQEHKKEIRELQDKLKSIYDEGVQLKSGFEKQLQEAMLKVAEERNKDMKPVVNQRNIAEKEISLPNNSPIVSQKKQEIEKKITFDDDSISKILQPPPIVKRKAFVYQKTFQEDSDNPEENNAVKPTNEGDILDRSAVNYFDVKNNQINPNVDLVKRIENKDNGKLNARTIDSSGISVEEEKSNVSLSVESIVNIKDAVESLRDLEVHSNTTEETTEESETESGTIREESESYSEEENTMILQKQLALQSLQSMEEVLASNPEILKELKTELIHLLDRRLQGLGIDPEWSGVPKKTFKTKLAVLKHHQKITAKCHTGYFTLRDHMLQNLEDRCMTRPNESKPTPKQNILAKLRKRASQVLSMAKPNLRLTRQGNQKLPTTLAEIKNSSATKLAGRDVIGNIPKPVDKEEMDSPCNAPRPEEEPLVPRPAAREFINRPKEISQSLPTVKVVDTAYNEDLADPLQEVIGLGYKKPTMDSSLTRTRSEFVLSSSSENEEVKSPLDISQPVRIYKSALRNAASTGNLAKKKVVFLDELFNGNKRSFSDDMMNITPSEECATPRNSVTSMETIQSIDDMEDQPIQRGNHEFSSVVYSTPRSYTLQLPKSPSPASSLTSIGSSLLDISPTEEPKSKSNIIKNDMYTLEWSLEDIEENLKSD